MNELGAPGPGVLGSARGVGGGMAEEPTMNLCGRECPAIPEPEAPAGGMFWIFLVRAGRVRPMPAEGRQQAATRAGTVRRAGGASIPEQTNSAVGCGSIRAASDERHERPTRGPPTRPGRCRGRHQQHAHARPRPARKSRHAAAVGPSSVPIRHRQEDPDARHSYIGQPSSG